MTLDHLGLRLLRPHSVATQPQPRHDLDNAARRLRAILRWGLCGDFDQKDAGQGSRVYLSVLVEDALAFFGDPHAAISDGIRYLLNLARDRIGLKTTDQLRSSFIAATIHRRD